ncbi:hypothetical protein K504DRAFT_30637 [Pleomassaria siparia CBS 279.74]|uniref:Uncharacterized protein n=1 Tax=Pleomassaria siparia CBS 279.74 TaxID=1314801 RepID=A0A6G1KRZ1_9PLEO|nr:hypothetical protein K504DRAFT_30637 [Pleomassaria siparia CBS 279.74]
MDHLCHVKPKRTLSAVVCLVASLPIRQLGKQPLLATDARVQIRRLLHEGLGRYRTQYLCTVQSTLQYAVL